MTVLEPITLMASSSEGEFCDDRVGQGTDKHKDLPWNFNNDDLFPHALPGVIINRPSYNNS